MNSLRPFLLPQEKQKLMQRMPRQRSASSMAVFSVQHGGGQHGGSAKALLKQKGR